MQTIITKQELYTQLETYSGLVLVIFWKRGCPGCMKVSKLLPLLESNCLPVISFDCTVGMAEAKTLGVQGTPRWLLFENGKIKAEIQPAADDDALWEFLTEKAGVDLLRPIFDMALEKGRAYTRQMQDAVAEIMFRSGDDDEGILSAARLKITKACVEASEDEMESCIEAQIRRCESRLRERMTQKGQTEARITALEKLPDLKEEIMRTLCS